MFKPILRTILITLLQLLLLSKSSGEERLAENVTNLCAQKINDYNQTWLLNHQKRLSAEISELNSALGNLGGWQLTQTKMILEMKKEVLSKIERSFFKLVGSPQQYKIFRNTNELDVFLSTGFIPSKSEKIGFIGKSVGVDSFSGNNVMSPRVEQNRNELVKMIIKSDFSHMTNYPDCLFQVREMDLTATVLDSLGGEKNMGDILALINKIIPEVQKESKMRDMAHLSALPQCILRSSMGLEFILDQGLDEPKEIFRSRDLLLSDPRAFFNKTKFPEMAAFLNKLGLKKPLSFIQEKEKSLENDFLQVRSQIVQSSGGTRAYDVKTKACTGFAIVSDMEFSGKTPLLSAGLAYGMARANALSEKREKVQPLPDEVREVFNTTQMFGNDDNFENRARLNDELDQGVELQRALRTLKENGVSTEKEFPFTNEQGQLQFLPKKLSDIKGQKFKIGEFSYVENKNKSINYGLIKLLINSRQPPIAILSSDARIEEENWAHPQRKGNFMHVVNVVGYGEAVDPSDFKLKPVVILRDSLSKKGINLTMSAEKFLANLSGLVKVTSVLEEK